MTSVLGGGNQSVNGPGGVIDFVESVAAQVEVAGCQGYDYCINAIQDIMRDNNPSILFRINSEIINNLHGGNSGYRIYYLNNLDGAKGLEHTAILIVDADGNGDFYSYMGGIGKRINEETEGYVAHITMSNEETREFLRTGNIVIEMPSEDKNERNKSGKKNKIFIYHIDMYNTTYRLQGE